MKTEELAIHPYAQRFPRLGDEELTDLAHSIQESGQMDPIVIDIIDEVETILDGRNRLAACEIAGIEPQFETLEAFSARTACCFAGPVQFIAARNIRRRHLSASVAATLAIVAVDELASVNGDQDTIGADDELAAEFAEETKSYPETGPGRPKTSRGKAQDHVADDTGVSKRDLQRAEALRDARPDLFKKVESGKLKLQAAEERMRADEKREAAATERKEALKLISDETQPFRDAVAQGQYLKKTKDIVEYAALTRDKKTHIRNLMGKGWTFFQACQYMDMEVTEATTVKRLIGLAAYSGGRLEIAIDDHVVTVERAGKAVEK